MATACVCFATVSIPLRRRTPGDRHMVVSRFKTDHGHPSSRHVRLQMCLQASMCLGTCGQRTHRDRLVDRHRECMRFLRRPPDGGTDPSPRSEESRLCSGLPAAHEPAKGRAADGLSLCAQGAAGLRASVSSMLPCAVLLPQALGPSFTSRWEPQLPPPTSALRLVL